MTGKNQTEAVIHTFQPVFDSQSKILMLGTMPSPKSRETGFYYGHPRNRFWRVLADILEEPVPETIEEKKALALKHHIAIWDVLAGCEIRGADDGSIKNPVPNDLSVILKQAPVNTVFTTGTKADELYKKYIFSQTGIPSIRLLSTSPANCRTGYEALKDNYSQILGHLQPEKYVIFRQLYV